MKTRRHFTTDIPKQARPNRDGVWDQDSTIYDATTRDIWLLRSLSFHRSTRGRLLSFAYMPSHSPREYADQRWTRKPRRLMFINTRHLLYSLFRRSQKNSRSFVLDFGNQSGSKQTIRTLTCVTDFSVQLSERQKNKTRVTTYRRLDNCSFIVYIGN